MTPTFNLQDEPWIPVRTKAGEVMNVSLRDALLKAADYVALAETSPPNLIAMHRVLLAVLHRSLVTQHGKWNDQDRACWFREGLPQVEIRAYLDKWRERFWLFHPSDPFMQVAALEMAEETREKQKAWPQIELEGACGNTPVVFNHAMDERPAAATFAIALRNMLGFFQFTPGGLVKTVRSSDKAGPLVNTAAVLPIGRSLSETLLLALHPYESQSPDDLPSWERPMPTIMTLSADPTLASGPNDRYTRLSRAVLLLKEGGLPTLHWIRFAAGIALEEDPNAPDPMACYRINKDGKAIRVTYREGRAIWRDLPSLIPDPGHATDIPPAVLGWAANLLEALGEWDSPVEVITAGIASKEAKLLRWRAERIEMPQAFLRRPDAASFLRMQVRYVEEVHEGLRNVLADMIAQTMPDPKHKDTRTRARDILSNGPASAVYFSAAERALPLLMRQIAKGEIEEADLAWKATLVEAASQAWNATRQSLGDSPAVLRADARVWPRFRVLLKPLMPTVTLAATIATSTTEEVPV